MKADRADYPDSTRVRVNVISVFEHKTQQFLTSITRFTVAQHIARREMLRGVSVKMCPTFLLCFFFFFRAVEEKKLVELNRMLAALRGCTEARRVEFLGQRLGEDAAFVLDLQYM